MKKIILLIFISVLLVGCNKESNNKPDIKNIISNSEYKIIDVRTEEEYRIEHIKDSINIPVNEIENIELDKNITILVYCKSGNRSKIAYNTLKSMGFRVYDLGAYNEIDLPKE